jgi:sulfatase maturation enzyme AslB (radical SAM superfamily)
MKQLRQDMITGDFSKKTKNTCSQCIYNAEKNIRNKRTNDNSKYLDSPKVKEAIDFVRNNPEKDLDPKYLEYVNFKSLGNLCNLKCIMCGPTASSKIFAEYKMRYPEKYKNVNPILNPYNDETKDLYWRDLEVVFENVNKFTLVGGESMIHPDFPEMFEMFCKNKNAKNVELSITSNGTVIPEYVLENAHRFKKLHFGMSIDGVGERGSYIRSGLDWNTWDKNCKRALQSDLSVSFSIAIQMLNVGYIDEVYEYLLDLGAEKNLSWSGLVTQPAHFRAINIPNELKKIYLTKISKSPVSKCDKAQSTIDILKHEQENLKDFAKGIQELKKLDEIRNTNLLRAFPEFEAYYKLNLKTI